MRVVTVALALLGLAAAAVAADPFVGTWKLNAAKTKFTAGAPPTQQTVVITEKGADLDVQISGTDADGAPIFSHYTIPIKGGPARIVKAPWDSISATRPNENERIIEHSKGGKVLSTVRPRISADGKTMTVTVSGTDTTGKPVAGTVVFEKVATEPRP